MSWVCANCNSTKLEISVEWGDSLEAVDQREQRSIEPVDCTPERAHIGHGFCNDCGANGPAHEVIMQGVADGVRRPKRTIHVPPTGLAVGPDGQRFVATFDGP